MGLDDEIGHLKAGIDTVLSRSGWPLSQPQTVSLKLATVLLTKPSVLVLGDIADIVETDILKLFIQKMAMQGTTVLYSTRREDMTGFTHEMSIGAKKQTLKELNEGLST
jgi:putative ABC transport system ATP-binding protein